MLAHSRKAHQRNASWTRLTQAHTAHQWALTVLDTSAAFLFENYTPKLRCQIALHMAIRQRGRERGAANDAA